MSVSRSTLALVTISVLCISAGSVFAAPITGTFDIGGSSATVTATALTFTCNATILTAPCPGLPGYGNFSVSTANGGFAPYASGSHQGGYIEGINSTDQPLNTFFTPLMDWMFFSSTVGNPVIPSDLTFDLTFIFLGVDPQAQCGDAPNGSILQVCTPLIPALVDPVNNPLGKSAYNLQNTQTGSTASFSVLATERRISTGETANVAGLFTAQFDVPYQTLLAELAAGSITNSYSATFKVTAVPEPQTTSLIAGGLLVLAGLSRKITRRRS